MNKNYKKKALSFPLKEDKKIKNNKGHLVFLTWVIRVI